MNVHYKTFNPAEGVAYISVFTLEPDSKSIRQTLIKENGGDTVASNPWGLKSLAYPIDKKTTGIYWILEFTGPATINEKLKIQFLRDEQIMRHMITKLDKYAVEYNHIKRNGGFPVHKAVEA
jgi:small subunit ribosomal protein S6